MQRRKITITVDQSVYDYAQSVVQSGEYRSLSHFFDYAGMFLRKNFESSRTQEREL
jgi:Arc/MetJ-type ribon-helix-helix transcriptional regulator